jgi:arabinogalactan oligomer/maltooligosaccharide transport system substrate-binding protein
MGAKLLSPFKNRVKGQMERIAMMKGPNRRQALCWMAKGLAGGVASTGALALSGCGPKEQVLRPNLIIWHGFRGAEKASLEKLAGDTITPLDFFLDEATKAAFLPNMFEAVTYKNAVWALPFNYKSIALLYNKALISKPPETIEEMQALAAKHTDQARGRFGLAYAYDDFFFHAALMNGFGGGVFHASGKLMLDDPRNIAASNLVQHWRRDLGILPDDPTSSLVASLFNSGRAAMIFNGPWFLGEIPPEIDYGAAVLPKITAAGNRPMAPYMAVEAIFMSAGTHDPAEAWAFAKFLTSLEAATIMAVEGGELPTLKAVYDVAEVARNPIAQAYKAQALSAIAMPNLPEMTMVWSPADKAMKRVTKLETTSEAAWKDCQREVQAAIEALHAGKAS